MPTDPAHPASSPDESPNPWLAAVSQHLNQLERPTAIGKSTLSFRARYIDLWNEQHRLGNWDYFVEKDSIGKFAQALAEGRMLSGIGSTDLELFPALECAYADRWDYAQRFAMRCLDAAAWVENSGALVCGPLAQWSYPRTLGEVRLFRAYAQWLLGAPLNRAAIKEAAQFGLDWMGSSGEATGRKVTKDPASQEWCIGGLRAAVLTGETGFAQQQLERFNLAWYMEEERNLYLRVVQESPRISPELRLDFERWFDRVRDPDAPPWHPELRCNFGIERTRLEVGIMRQMYLINASPSDQIDVRAVIESIRA